MGSQGGSFTRRLPITLALFSISLVISLALFTLGFPFFFLFLFIPLIPFLTYQKDQKKCPVCGWVTKGDEGYCPYDGVLLETQEKVR